MKEYNVLVVTMKWVVSGWGQLPPIVLVCGILVVTMKEGSVWMGPATTHFFSLRYTSSDDEGG